MCFVIHECFILIYRTEIKIDFNLADRAKQIKTKAIVNEDPTEKLIRELKVDRKIDN